MPEIPSSPATNRDLLTQHVENGVARELVKLAAEACDVDGVAAIVKQAALARLAELEEGRSE